MRRAMLRDGLPIYESLKRAIRERILSGELKPGDRVPSEHALAAELSVSRNQTRQALRDLELEGFLERSRGRGSFVAHPHRRLAQAPRGAKTVGFAYPRFSPHGQTRYFHLLIRGFSDRLCEADVAPQFHYVDLHEDSELAFLSGVRSSGVQGVALLPHSRSPQLCRLVESLSDSRFPCVLFDHLLPVWPMDFVCTDNRRSYRTLTEELLSMGHRRVAYIAYNLDTSVMEDRLAGYLGALEHSGIPHDPNLVVNCGLCEATRPQDGSLEALLAMPSRPSAFVCSDRITAEFVEESLMAAGATVPSGAELALMDDQVDVDSSGDLTRLTAAQDGYGIGRRVAMLLLARMADPGRSVEQHFLRARFLFDRYAYRDRRRAKDWTRD